MVDGSLGDGEVKVKHMLISTVQVQVTIKGLLTFWKWNNTQILTLQYGKGTRMWFFDGVVDKAVNDLGRIHPDVLLSYPRW